jgi:RsiW-degrading membrane proteinase PrsW (M82 family)
LGSGRHFAFIQYVLDIPTILHTQVLDFAAHIIYTSALLLCRMSGLAFYYRLCSLHNGFRIAIQVVFGVLVAAFLPQLFLLIFHCRPVTGYWPYGWEPIANDYSCLQWGVVYCVNSSVSLLCDFLLFGIPVAMLRILEMSRKRKVQLGCILLPGIA